jgi:hypothetical protein
MAGVVLRWGLADAHEFLHPDADFRNAAIVPKLTSDSRRRTSAQTVVIGGDLDNPLPRFEIPESRRNPISCPTKQQEKLQFPAFFSKLLELLRKFLED